MLHLRASMHYMRPTKIAICHLKPANQTISDDGLRGMEVAIFSTKERSTTMKNLGRGIGGALLSLAFVFGIVAATSSATQAQDRNQHRNDDGNYQRGHRNDDRKARKREWKRRRKEDRRDARDRNNQGDWRRNRDQNRNNGVYNNGQYGRNRGYGNNGGYDRVELDRGYQQGLNTGASDGQRGQSYNPQRSRHFKNASSQTFREGFVRGYDQGYRQYSGNGNQRNGSSNGGWGDILGGILGRP